MNRGHHAESEVDCEPGENPDGEKFVSLTERETWPCRR